MSRSLRVSPSYTDKVKLAVKRHRFPSNHAFADSIGFARSTVNNFLNGKPVDFFTFTEICHQLELDWQAIAHFEEEPETFTPQLYVERPPIEANCRREILQAGSLIRIKAPRKMGKTWLINYIFDAAAKEKFRTVRLNILQPTEEVMDRLEALLKWFCCRVSKLLKLEEKLAESWDDGLGGNDNCTAYFEDWILSKIDTPLVLALDNVDRVFRYPEVAPDFLGLLRSWFEDSRVMPEWKKLRLVVAHSTDVYIPLNINKSPFNVGLAIELPEFSSQQIQDLAALHGLCWHQQQIDDIMAMVGGHPYLVQEVFAKMKGRSEIGWTEVWRSAPTEAGIYANHLREHLVNLQTDAKLVAAMKKVVEASEPVRLDAEEGFKLNSLGLVRKQGNKVEPRCNLYRLYFQDRLADSYE